MLSFICKIHWIAFHWIKSFGYKIRIGKIYNWGSQYEASQQIMYIFVTFKIWTWYSIVWYINRNLWVISKNYGIFFLASCSGNTYAIRWHVSNFTQLSKSITITKPLKSSTLTYGHTGTIGREHENKTTSYVTKPVTCHLNYSHLVI